MTDALRDNRTDSALIRVIVPVIENNIDRAMATAADFVKVTFTPIRQQMPVSQAAERDLETGPTSSRGLTSNFQLRYGRYSARKMPGTALG